MIFLHNRILINSVPATCFPLNCDYHMSLKPVQGLDNRVLFDNRVVVVDHQNIGVLKGRKPLRALKIRGNPKKKSRICKEFLG